MVSLHSPHSPVRTVFMGTPDFAVPTLTALVESRLIEVVLVVTQPDKPVGRGQVLTPPPVKTVALTHHLPVFQPSSLKKPEAIQKILDTDAELLVLIAYAKMVPNAMLDFPKYGCVNLHLSLLPELRGSSPVQTAIVRGDQRTGVTLMKIAPEMDAGDILAQKSMPIQDEDTGDSLRQKLGLLSAELLNESLPQLIEGTLIPTPQDPALVTLTKPLKRSDGLIDWQHKSVQEIERQIRAYTSWPGSYTMFEGKRLKILKAKLADTHARDHEPGSVFEADGTILVQCKEGALELTEVQIEGKKPIEISEFTKGYPNFTGALLR